MRKLKNDVVLFGEAGVYNADDAERRHATATVMGYGSHLDSRYVEISNGMGEETTLEELAHLDELIALLQEARAWMAGE